MENKFLELSQLNVNDKVEEKNKLKYLSWSWAWSEFCKIYPNATYKVLKDDKMNCAFGNSEQGYMVYTEVTANGLTHEMWLPVMDFKNKSMLAPTTFDTNKAVMRCLTKNLAMFGLGLYIYSGEDLPEELPKSKEEIAREEIKAKESKNDKIKELMSIVGDDTDKFDKTLAHMNKLLKKENTGFAQFSFEELEAYLNKAKAKKGE
jgi:hypothetical protein